MSGGVIYRRALQVVDDLEVTGTADREAVAALEAARQDALLQLLYEAGHEAGLAREDLLERAVGCFLSYAAGNLADDLIDGECDYLEDPIRLGPSTQFLLQHASQLAWLRSKAPREALARAADQLARAAGPNHVEVRTTRWTADVFRLVGEAISGRQWAAYLEVLWGGTALEGRAGRVGVAMGAVGHLAEDVRSEDVRWTSLPPEEKEAVRRWALSLVAALREERLAIVDYTLRGAELVLGEGFGP